MPETSPTPDNEKRWRWGLYAFCAVLLTGLWAAQFTRYLDPTNDGGRYTVLAQSLAAGEMRLINEPKKPFDTLYPPAYPALIAGWMKIVGGDFADALPGVKVTQLLGAILCLPLLYALCIRAGLPLGYRAAALLFFSLAPPVATYAGQIMSEGMFLPLGTAAIVLAETINEPRPPLSPVTLSFGRWRMNADAVRLYLAALCTVAAYLTRSIGLALLLTLSVGLWPRAGAKWGAVAVLALILTVGGWNYRNKIIAAAPNSDASSVYASHFTLRDPMKPGSGRIPFTLSGLTERAFDGLQQYAFLTPRAFLDGPVRAAGSPALMMALSFPLIALLLIGLITAFRRGLYLTGAFAVLVWLFSVMWPWREVRLLFPILPLMILFVVLGAERVAAWLAAVRVPVSVVRVVQIVGVAALLIYAAQVHWVTIQRERGDGTPYPTGRNPAEKGFYAACAFLRQAAPQDAIIMGRPAYLLYLLTDRPAVQIEPETAPNAQEYNINRRNARYLLRDDWYWSHTDIFLGPYLKKYRARWRIVWQSPDNHTIVYERLAVK